MVHYNFASPPPFAHQKEGLRQLIEKKSLALLCEPGTGKSRIVVDYLGCLSLGSNTQVRCLIVAPKSVQDSWLDQFDNFLPSDVTSGVTVLKGSIEEKCDQLSTSSSDDNILVRIVNIEALSSKRKKKGYKSVTHQDMMLKAVKEFNPHVVVFDESHRLKSPSGNASRLAYRIAKCVPRRLLLTGTPMPHSPMDVYAQWRLLDDTVFAFDGRPWSFGQFKAYFGVLGGFAGSQVVGYRRLDELERYMAPRSFVARKAECLDLPPVTEIVHRFDLSKAETAVYDRMKQNLLVELSTGASMTATNRLTQLLRLRQVCCGFMKDDDGGITDLGFTRQKECLSLLEDLFGTEKRIVVFAWSRAEVECLVEAVNKSKSLFGAKALKITGDVSESERLAIRKRFGDTSTDERLLLVAQSRTISLGINELVSASYGIFLSLSQQRDDLLQGIARLDRQGQTRPVTLYYMVGKGTVDEVILKSHRERTDLETDLLQHLRK